MTNSESTISEEEVRRVADLAMLNLTDSEVETYTPQLGSIIGLVAKMDEFDLDGFEPTAHPHGLVNVYRQDEVEAVDVTNQVMENAPDSESNQFKVPPALGEEL